MSITIRVRHPRGTDRVQAQLSWTFEQLMGAFSGQRGLCRAVTLFEDPRCERPVSREKWKFSLGQLGLTNGSIFYANLAPLPPSSAEELGLTRPPRIGPDCAHDPSMRCPKCYDAWREACRLSRTEEEAEMYSDLELPEPPAPRFGENSRDVAYLQYLESIQPKIKAEEPGTDPVLVSEGAWRRVQSVIQQAHKLDKSALGVCCKADCYGKFNRDGSVVIESFRVPPQRVPDRPELVPVAVSDPEQQGVDAVSAALGFRRVGQLYVVPKGRKLESAALSSYEVLSAAQTQLKYGRHSVTLIATFDMQSNEFDIQAYRASTQLCKLQKAGYIKGPNNDVSVAIRPDKAVKLNMKTVHEVAAEYFTVLVPIKAAQNDQLLLDSAFPLDAVSAHDWQRLQQFVQTRMREGLGADRVFADFGALSLLATIDESVAVEVSKAVRHHDSTAPISDAVLRVGQVAGRR